MKRSTILLFAAALVATFISCTDGEDGLPGPEGPRGPIGPEGPQGAPGESAYVFEYENINFTSPDFEQILVYPDNFEGFVSDVALVYLLWGSEEINGEQVEIWRPLSQTVLHPSGTLIYNYDFTPYDARLFLQADFPLEELSGIDTDNWVARVVVVPGNFWDSGRVDISDYYQVKEMLGLKDLPEKQKVVERRKVK